MENFSDWILEHLKKHSEMIMIAYKDRGYSKYIMDKIRQDTEFHLTYLAHSMALNSCKSFVNYTKWVRELMYGLGFDDEGVIGSYELIKDALAGYHDLEALHKVSNILDEALSVFEEPIVLTDTYIMDDNPLKKEANEYMGYLLNSNREAAYDLIVRTLKTKALKDIYLNIIQVSQYEIGRLWQKGDVSVAQEHYCTASTQLIMAKMYPLVFTTPHASTKILACCIGNELHELGIRMIADLLEVDGYDTLYLGANTPLEAIRSTVLGRDIDMVIISTTMLRNVQYVKELIAKLKEEAIKVKILVGGHPFNQDDNLWKEVGADAHSFDAAEALELVKRMSYE